MPELPDVLVYCEALERHYVGRTLARIDVKSPFVVRTFEPDLLETVWRRLEGVSRVGKRIVWRMEGGLAIVFHLMIAGRFHQKKPGARPRSKADLVAFHFAESRGGAIERTLLLTEASPKRRASIHVLDNPAALAALDLGGLDPLAASLDEFRDRLLTENHTLKRALTDPRLLDGIGAAYSDEILHAARLSPLKWTARLTDEEAARLYEAAHRTLREWTDRLRRHTGEGFPEKVTAFRPEMAAHGKYGQPCPACGTAIQRIRYADNETNYCPRCQTDGKLLADRSLSRLLKGDWPKSIEELEDAER